VSAGSACSSGRIEPSHVLLAMEIPSELAACAIRVSGGWATTESDIQDFTRAWISTCERLATKSA
jgi:cysteine desulfurase